MVTNITPTLAGLEHRLRTILPADLYAEVWLEPTPQTLTRVFEHLRTLQHMLYNYMPRQLSESLPVPGELRYSWQQGTLMFTDLAGFTSLMEANESYGRQGAEALLAILNRYFAKMLEIVSKSGGSLLEFTGDALLIQFSADDLETSTSRAVRAGLRMQHAMGAFSEIDTPHGQLSLGMRIGIHTGQFLTADIGTPRRMEHVLMGEAVHLTKKAEGAGQVGRVCLTTQAYTLVKNQFEVDNTNGYHVLVVDQLGTDELGTYEITVGRSARRSLSSALMLDRSEVGLLKEVHDILPRIESLACYVPDSVLNLLVESAAQRQITPQFSFPTAMFVNITELPQSADRAEKHEEEMLVSAFSRIFSLINAAVQARGGILKKVTYHLYGSDMLIIFGVPNAHTDDPRRAANAALAIRDVVNAIPSMVIGGQELNIDCQIGLDYGSIFAAEIGERRGRREYNVLSDTVNTAARLMAKAEPNQILMSEPVYERIKDHFVCENLGVVQLKGKVDPVTLYALMHPIE